MALKDKIEDVSEVLKYCYLTLIQKEKKNSFSKNDREFLDDFSRTQVKNSVVSIHPRNGILK